MAKKSDNTKMQDLGVQRLQQLLTNQTEKNRKDELNELAANMYDEAFDGLSTSSPKDVVTKLLFAAMWYSEQKLRLHQFEMHGVNLEKERKKIEEVAKLQTEIDTAKAVGVDPAILQEKGKQRMDLTAKEEVEGVVEDQLEYLVSEGFGGILAKGGYISSYNGPKGTKFNQLLYGNGWRLVLATGNSKMPVKFVSVPNDAVYRTVSSTHLRQGDKPSQEAALVFRVPKEQFMSDFAEEIKKAGLEEKDIYGFIRTDGSYKSRDLTQSKVGKGAEVDGEVEYAYFWKISDTSTPKSKWQKHDCGRMYRLVVGSQMSILAAEDGNEYSWNFEDEDGQEKAYIPLTERTGIKMARGQFGAGIAQLVGDLASVDRKTTNLMSGSVYEDTYPVNFVGIPKGNEETFGALYQDALRNRSQGKNALVPLVVDKESGGIQSYQVRNNGNLNGAMALKREIELTLKRVGIHLDEMQGYAATATQAEFDAQKQTDFISYLSEHNQAEALFELRIALDIIKKTKGGKNVPLDIRVQYEGGKPIKSLTFGALKDMISNHHWFFTIDPSSAEVPNLALRRASLRESMQYIQGGPYAEQASRELLQLSGINVKKVDTPPPMQDISNALQ